MVSYSVKVEDGITNFHSYTDIDFLTELRDSLAKASLIVGFNLKYDINVVRRKGIRPHERTRIWDCQIAEFIIEGQANPYPSLDGCLAKYDLGKKDNKIAEYWELGINTNEIPVDELRVYGNLDVDLTYKLYLQQQEIMTEKQKKLCLVMGLDLLVLADMEWNGVKFDLEKCETKAKETAQALLEVSNKLLEYSPHSGINLDSGHQLSCLLYGGAFELTRVSSVDTLIYKSGPRKGVQYKRNQYETDVVTCERLFEPIKGSQTKLVSRVDGKEYPVYATGEEVLKKLRRPTKRHKGLIGLLLKRAEYAKLMDTYYGALPSLLETMEWGNMIHGQYNQVTARTGRLSSSKPNMQNFSGPVDELLISRYV